jgi:hypothetical protein
MFIGQRPAAVMVCAALSVLVAAEAAYSGDSLAKSDPVALELAGLGKRGAMIERSREQVLTVLQGENGCAAWFQEVEPEPAEVFRSLHYIIEEHGPFYVLHARDQEGREVFKHPWSARALQNSGRDSFIRLNTRGAFFTYTSPVLQVDPEGPMHWPGDRHRLFVASYSGDTGGARMAILLHELGHIVGRLPEDDDNWDGRSDRNSEEVIRHCGREIRESKEKSSHTGD